MKEKVKLYGSIALFVTYLLFIGAMSYQNYKHPNPRILEYVRTPVSWIDVGMGFVMGIVLMTIVLMFPLVWPYRKREGGGPNNGGDGGPQRKINLPILGKVISIDDLKKMPPKGPIQLAPTGS